MKQKTVDNESSDLKLLIFLSQTQVSIIILMYKLAFSVFDSDSVENVINRTVNIL